MCGAVMTILDSTIVNVAIARLAVVFDARLATIQWVSTAYLLALAAVIGIYDGPRQRILRELENGGHLSLSFRVKW